MQYVKFNICALVRFRDSAKIPLYFSESENLLLEASILLQIDSPFEISGWRGLCEWIFEALTSVELPVRRPKRR